MVLSCPQLWQEWLELGIVCSIVTLFNLWLLTSRRLPLLLIAYAYSAVIFCIYTIPLPLLIPMVPLITPVLLVVLVLLHKDCLQRNIVPYTRINSPMPSSSHDWLSQLLRSSISMLNKSKKLIILFECADEVEPFLDTAYTLHARINESVLSLFLHDSIIIPERLIWVRHTGFIISSNVLWKNPPHTKTMHQKIVDYSCKDLSLFYSGTINCAVCVIDQNNRTGSLIIYGSLFESLTMHEIYIMLKKHLYGKSADNSCAQKGSHAKNIKHASPEHTTYQH